MGPRGARVGRSIPHVSMIGSSTLPGLAPSHRFHAASTLPRMLVICGVPPLRVAPPRVLPAALLKCPRRRCPMSARPARALPPRRRGCSINQNSALCKEPSTKRPLQPMWTPSRSTCSAIAGRRRGGARSDLEGRWLHDSRAVCCGACACSTSSSPERGQAGNIAGVSDARAGRDILAARAVEDAILQRRNSRP